MSLLGLIRHMTDVERSWFRRRVAGEEIEALYWSDASPDGDFDDLDPADAEADFAAYAARGRGGPRGAGGAATTTTRSTCTAATGPRRPSTSAHSCCT